MTMFQTLSRVTPVVNTRPGRLSKNQLDQWAVACTVLLLFAITAIAAPAQTLTTLAGFNEWTVGNHPSSLIQGTDGTLYGTTSVGTGAPSGGSVFNLTQDGTMTIVYAFCSQANCADGGSPQGMILATDGNFYGTTGYGGTVFKVTSSGTLSTLSRGVGGSWAGVIQAADGNFYGTTFGGGTVSAACSTALYSGVWGGCGTIFKITPSGKLTTLYSFCSQTNCSDGLHPAAALVQGSDGNLYGTTVFGGAGQSFAPLKCTNGCGTIFKITPTGHFTTLHRFCSLRYCADGGFPYSALIQAADGNFYGAASGINALGDNLDAPSTLFKITPAGNLSVLHHFCKGGDCADGSWPTQLTQATDGSFYGTTVLGGANNAGTVYKITPAGALTTLYSFCSIPFPNCEDGANPGNLFQGTDGNFYGTAGYGGPGGSYGTVFRLSMGLSPFVSFIRNSGEVGKTAQILGQGLIGTTGVSFNGAPASFTVHSDSYLTATIPVGAEWGFVTVTTPGGTLKSNQRFRVTPQVFGLSTGSGSVGSAVVITGMSLARTYAITFGNVKATNYTVDSDTQVTVTVPAGAKNGKIAVLTPGGTAYSPGCFEVTP